MSPKIRKQIYIDSEQEVTLKQVSEEMGVSEAEIIRQAIAKYGVSSRPQGRDLRAWERLRSRMEQSIDRGPIGDKHTWKREDLYDRHQGFC